MALRLMAIKTVKVAAIMLLCVVGGIVLLTLPECVLVRVMIVNASGVALEDVGLFNRGEEVWSGRFGRDEGRWINLAEASARYVELRGKYVSTGEAFLGQSIYPMPHDSMIHGFIITKDNVVIAPWHDQLSAKPYSIYNTIVGELACLDVALWRWIRRSK